MRVKWVRCSGVALGQHTLTWAVPQPSQPKRTSNHARLLRCLHKHAYPSAATVGSTPTLTSPHVPLLRRLPQPLLQRLLRGSGARWPRQESLLHIPARGRGRAVAVQLLSHWEGEDHWRVEEAAGKRESACHRWLVTMHGMHGVDLTAGTPRK